jgi:ankyrin repeat protein
VHGRDQYGWSALHHVAQNSRSDQAAERIFDELCTHEWSPEQLDYVTGQNVPDSMHLPKGWTALHLLANGGGDSSALRRRMAARLLMMRANPTARTETGATPLHTAAGTANVDIVRLLLSEAKATVNSKNKNKKTPFDMARSNKQVRDMIAAAGGIPSNDYTGGSARDLPNARAGTSYARQQRAAEWRNRG